MAFRLFGGGRKKTADATPQTEGKPASVGPVGVREADRRPVAQLYEAFSTHLSLYWADAQDHTARRQSYPGALLPELMPGLFNAVRFDIIPDQVENALQRLSDDAAVTPLQLLPDLLHACGGELRQLADAKADANTKAHRKLEAIRRTINLDTEFLDVREQRLSAVELEIWGELFAADPHIREVVEALIPVLNPEIVDLHGEEDGDWFELWDRALIDLKRMLVKVKEKIEEQSLPERTVPLIFITLMNRRVVRPGQLTLLLKAHLLHMDAALFEETEFSLVVECLLVKLNDHTAKINGMLMEDLRCGVRLAHMESFIDHYREFHAIYYGMLEDLSLADHPQHGVLLEQYYSQVVTAILEKLMPAIGALTFDLLPDPAEGVPRSGLRKRTTTTGLTDMERIPKDADTDKQVLVPFFRTLREAARDCAMDKPALEVERGLINGLQNRLKAFVTDLQGYLEETEDADFSVMTRALMNMDEIYTALSTLEFETTLQNARSYIRTAVKFSIKQATTELERRQEDPEALKALLDERHAALARLIARLVAEHEGDLEENGRFADPGMLEVLVQLDGILLKCYGPLGEASAVALTTGRVAHAEQILMVCDDLAEAFDTNLQGRPSEIAARQPKAVRTMLCGAVDILMKDVADSGKGRDMKIKLLGAAEAVKRLHDYFSRRGDKEMAGELLKKLQIGLVAVQTGR